MIYSYWFWINPTRSRPEDPIAHLHIRQRRQSIPNRAVEVTSLSMVNREKIVHVLVRINYTKKHVIRKLYKKKS